MREQSDPWGGIEAQSLLGKLRARRVDAGHPYDFYWGLDAKGQQLLLFRSNIELDCSTELPTIHGISLELEPYHFTIRLLNSNDLEIFTTLCWSLIERTRNIQTIKLVIEHLVAHLVRWQKFLGKNSRGLLSQDEIRGLFCELFFLQENLIPHYGVDSVYYWHGPSGYPQDFAIGSTLFEIKSHLAGAQPILSISSAEQLWFSSGELFLVAYTIGEAPKSFPKTQSLKQLVDSIRHTLSNPDLIDVFDDRLMEIKYTDHPEYDKQHFTVSHPEFFKVNQTFPRITSDEIRQGVCNVRYGVELAACLPFRSEPSWDLLGATNGN